MTTNSRKRRNSPAPSSGVVVPSDDGAGGHEHDYPFYASCAPKRLRQLAERSTLLPTEAIAVRNRRVERQALRKRERVAAVSAGMEVDNR